jgi:hypothetical protein
MKSQQRRRAVSVVVATLLLIAIAVAAGTIVYVFVTGVAGNLTQNGGQPVTEKLTIQSYTFGITPGSCACSQQVVEIFLMNPGPALTKVSAVYFDGNLLTLATPPVVDTPLVNNAYYLLPSTTTLASGTSGQIRFSANTQLSTYPVTAVGQLVITFTSPVTYGSGHTVKVVSSTGSASVFTVVSGIAG